MSERIRNVVEGVGALFIVAGVSLIDLAAGALTAGVILIWAANMYRRGGTDAGTDGDDSTS